MRLKGVHISVEKPRSFKNNVLVSLAGGVAGRLITLVSLSICAKFFYTQEDIGYWGTLFSISMFIAPLAIWRYELAIVLPKSDDRAKLVGFGATVLIALFTLLVTAIIVLDLPEKWFPDFVALDIVILLPLLLFQQNIRKIAEYWLIRLKKFYVVTVLDLTQSVLIAVFSIGLGYLYAGEVAVFSYANFFAIVIGSAIFTIVAMQYGLFKGFSSFNFKDCKRELIEYRAYPLYLTPYTLSNGLNQYAFIVMLTASYGAGLSGAYVLAHRLVYSPVLLLVIPIRQVFYAYSSTKNGKLDDESKKRQKLILSYLVWVVPPIAFSGSVIIEFVLSWFLGDEFKEAIEIAKILVFTASANVLAGWMDRTYDLLGRQRLSVTMQLISDITIFSCAAFLIYSGQDSMSVIRTFALLLLGYQFLWVIVTLKVTGWSHSEVLKVVIILLVGSALFLIVYQYLNTEQANDISRVFSMGFLSLLWVGAASAVGYYRFKSNN